MQTCLHADEDFCIAEAQQYMWPTGQNIVKLAHVLMDFRGTMQREVLSSEFIVQAFNLPIRSCITL